MKQNPSAPNPACDSLDAEVVATAIREHQRNQPIALLASAGAPVFVILEVAPIAPAAIWASWLAVMAAQVGVRILFLLIWLREKPGTRAMGRWGRWAVWSQLASGIAWGGGAVLLNPAGAMEQQLFLTLIVSMLATTSGGAFATVRNAFLAFYLPCMLPLPFMLFFIGGSAGWLTGIMLLLYSFFFARFSLRTNRNMLESIRLRLEQTLLAQALADRTAIAETAVADKSRFLASASHDLRQPMHALTLFVEALKSADTAAARDGLVHNIEQSLMAMDSLFLALLDVSKLDAGVVRPSLTDLPAQTLLDRVALNFTGPMASKGLRLTVLPSTAWVRGDPGLCEQMLNNLVSNALRYTQTGGVLVGCRRDGADVRFVVYDTGIGIEASALNEVWKEFVQIGNPERDRRKGLGLGLAIVRRIADLLDAPIYVRSQPSRGSVFGFSLPRARPRANFGPCAPVSVDTVDTTVLAGCFVAVLDDEIHIREAMLALLRSWGVEVAAAHTCAALVELLNAAGRAPDALICDYRLAGGASGIDAIHRVRDEFNDDIPALLVTGDTAADRLIQAEASGLPLLHKPVKPQQLRRTLAAMIRQRTYRAPLMPN
ncbi:ATP-binding response regulator [Paraburkholderia caballeronis]|uniref:histidine kinase n=1 Tax=Paraburkholderia caballeronis TaxID=416943 RepID=A0A1H7UDE2_9BURK|nr:hybrid sensor histidine kinase/response regulator [Paraburkholderia caballeronis]PXW23288.1 signal transduction histidine kinase [Paraburkholderia caballeronis]PXW98281.1 signal transduction histidine kinase [Paraburkholderia caballeronis]RAJ95011.1 signal transduction histidine kinase [Paraburkholderia caballeronis]SEC61858.1 Signal transduction histidine kinase [Paraburkholderia caballeronis]SEL94277.1 Signal transduction histidine kinase [Paraburkholderia caballeronis]